MLKLHALLGDHAVLQANKPIAISGTANPGATVRALLGDAAQETVANAKGSWSIAFPARPAGVALHLEVTSGAQQVTASDLITGEVWLCSGQSNMEWTLGMIKDSASDIAAATDPLIRCTTIPRVNAVEPTSSMAAVWKPATPAAAATFSAVAWFFARRLREVSGVPVGLIVSAWGGSCIAPWMPREALARRPRYSEMLTRADVRPVANEEQSMEPHPLTGRLPVSAGWEKPDFDDAEWKALRVPGLWQDQSWRFNGAVWYRAVVQIPAAWKGRVLKLDFGPIDDFDDTFVNGVRVGGIGPENPGAYSTPRSYEIPASAVTSAQALIAVRVFDIWGKGGIVGGGMIHLADDPASAVPLPKEWKAKSELELPLRLGGGEIAPTGLYNGMIHPLLGFPLRGFLWYQGESDASQARLYRLMLPDLIASWRQLWSDPIAPFGIVQLANYMAAQAQPCESEWAELREAQLMTARTVPHTGLAVALDLGEELDIHPRYKKPVGERLAHWALATVYGQYAAAWRHPDLADWWKTTGAIVVRLAHSEAGLRARGGGPISGFQIAGEDRLWRWADAVPVEFDTLRISSPLVSEPVAIRYAWQSNPKANLENSAGLPATSFRTDNWPLIADV